MRKKETPKIATKSFSTVFGPTEHKELQIKKVLRNTALGKCFCFCCFFFFFNGGQNGRPNPKMALNHLFLTSKVSLWCRKPCLMCQGVHFDQTKSC